MNRCLVNYLFMFYIGSSDLQITAVMVCLSTLSTKSDRQSSFFVRAEILIKYEQHCDRAIRSSL